MKKSIITEIYQPTMNLHWARTRSDLITERIFLVMGCQILLQTIYKGHPISPEGGIIQRRILALASCRWLLVPVTDNCTSWIRENGMRKLFHDGCLDLPELTKLLEPTHFFLTSSQFMVVFQINYIYFDVFCNTTLYSEVTQ